MLNTTIQISTLYEDLKNRIDELNEAALAVQQSRKIVDKALGDGNAYYGINTGFGVLARQRIKADKLKKLQRNLLLSHAVGVGDKVPKSITRLMLDMKIHSLGQGFSGISETTFKRLITWSKKGLIPAIPKKGSVGASGDLAPLAHLFLPLIGHGVFWNEEGTEIIEAKKVLQEQGLNPIELQPKDGLSLINGTQLMTAYGAWVLGKMTHLSKAADIIGAMSLEALQGSIKPFDERIAAIRPHAGHYKVSQNIRTVLQESEILESHRNCGKVQDPYCLRCIPQVHGASRDALEHAKQVFETEINAVTDNPLVFQNGDIISGGNFHGQPLALVLDYLGTALAELASISERRTYLLLEGHDGLPELLMENTGINSGFMIPQYTAAALVSENKVLSHPASVDSIPTSRGQEDHVSMGSIGALKLYDIFQNMVQVLAIELFTAAQALDFRKPLKPGNGVEIAHKWIRSEIPHAEGDYHFHGDLEKINRILKAGYIVKHVENNTKMLK